MFNYLYRRFIPSKASATDGGSHEYFYPIAEIDSEADGNEKFNQMADAIEEEFNVERGTEEFIEAALQCTVGMPANDSYSVSHGTNNPADLSNYEETWY